MQPRSLVLLIALLSTLFLFQNCGKLGSSDSGNDSAAATAAPAPAPTPAPATGPVPSPSPVATGTDRTAEFLTTLTAIDTQLAPALTSLGIASPDLAAVSASAAASATATSTAAARTNILAAITANAAILGTLTADQSITLLGEVNTAIAQLYAFNSADLSAQAQLLQTVNLQIGGALRTAITQAGKIPATVLPKVVFGGPPCLTGANCAFTYTLDAAVSSRIEFDWGTNDKLYLTPPASGSNYIYGQPNVHYTPVTGHLVFNPGDVLQTVHVQNTNPTPSIQMLIGVVMRNCMANGTLINCTDIFH
jgi:hypothetical protein